jgi:hypothetical protein
MKLATENVMAIVVWFLCFRNFLPLKLRTNLVQSVKEWMRKVGGRKKRNKGRIVTKM